MLQKHTCNSIALTIKCFENAKSSVTPLRNQCESTPFCVLKTQIVIHHIVLKFLQSNKSECVYMRNNE